MNDYPNIFEFATKESTLDSIVMWFLECYRRGEKDGPMYNLGKNFLTELVFKDTDIELTDDIEFECLRKQFCRMDVYACLKSKSTMKFLPIIFEDKTNTTLHNKQLQSYCEKVKIWCNENKYKAFNKEITFVYFKTGFIFQPEYDYVEAAFNGFDKGGLKFNLKYITLVDIIDFLDKYKNDYSHVFVFDEYRKYCGSLLSIQNKLMDWNTNESLCDEIGQGLFYTHLFNDMVLGDNLNKVNSGSKVSYCYRIHDFKDRSNISLRFEPVWKKRDDFWVAIPYLQIQFYRNDSTISDKYDEITSCVKGYVESNPNDLIAVDFDSRRPPKLDYKGAEISRFTFNQNGKNKPSDVAEYIRTLSEYLQKYMKDMDA